MTVADGPAPPGRSSYRPEIDGLRALAVGGVVAHHAGLAALPGGFTGVDVFFVISGYLITGIIAAEMAEGRFSQWRFLERRLRRIVPALAVMLAATGIAAWAVLSPEDFKPFAQSLTASALFGSNLLYAREVDYFYSAAGMKPLLHTWTLGVEEQFYLVFPLALILCRRWKPVAMLPMVALFGLASFVLALALVQFSPLAAFYLLPARLWEFALGAVCALLPAALRPGARGLPALAGLGLIAAGFVLITPETPAPGVMFLLPVLGTALVILFAVPANAAGRLLALPPLTWLGLVSFGIYLWHQPLLELARYIWFGDLPLAVTMALVAASVVFGWASYRWLEQPVRQRRLLAGRGALLTACGLALALPAAAGLAGHLRLLSSASITEAARFGGERPLPVPEPVIIPPAGPLPFVLYGDSHAMQYHAALTARFGKGALLAKTSCLSAPGLANLRASDPGGEECRAMPARLVALAQERGVRTIIWAQLWDRMIVEGDSETLVEPDSAAGLRAIAASLEQLANQLPQGTRIILIGNTPSAQTAAEPMFDGWLRCRAFRNAVCPTSYPAAKAQGIAINAALRALAARDPRFTFVDAAAPLCPAGRCRVVQDGVLNYWDAHHLTRTAANRVAATIDASLIQQ
ncbi:MAG: acyltransferase [Erythrobacter sp.]|nr:acyltransferase [Erythrobacter sp.]